MIIYIIFRLMPGLLHQSEDSSASHLNGEVLAMALFDTPNTCDCPITPCTTNRLNPAHAPVHPHYCSYYDNCNTKFQPMLVYLCIVCITIQT